MTWGRQCLDVHGADLQGEAGPDRHWYAADTGVREGVVPLLGAEPGEPTGEDEPRLQVSLLV